MSRSPTAGVGERLGAQVMHTCLHTGAGPEGAASSPHGDGWSFSMSNSSPICFARTQKPSCGAPKDYLYVLAAERVHELLLQGPERLCGQHEKALQDLGRKKSFRVKLMDGGGTPATRRAVGAPPNTGSRDMPQTPQGTDLEPQLTCAEGCSRVHTELHWSLGVAMNMTGRRERAAMNLFLISVQSASAEGRQLGEMLCCTHSPPPAPVPMYHSPEKGAAMCF